MSSEPTFDSISHTTQVVLLGVVKRHENDETPVQTHEIRKTCETALDGVETQVVGTITEADVMRSLYQLEDEGFVEEVETSQTSPTGKGRPAYTLAVDAEMIFEGVDGELLEDDLE